MWSTWRSDKRKAQHDHDVLAKKTADEKRVREEQQLFDAATDFVSVCSEILMSAIDVKGAFNGIRDMFTQAAGLPDRKAMEKLMFAETQMDEAKRIAVPFNKLRVGVASADLLSAATRLNTSIVALTRTTTEPFARMVAMKAAGGELDAFINAFRKECGREEYLPSAAHRDVMSFMEMLKKQVADYLEEAKHDMREAGFTRTPWD